MSILDLLRRTLSYFARSNVAVIAGVVAATATIAGALIVGDSVRGSLRDMTLARLGNIETILTGPRFVTEATARKLDESSVPAILLAGTTKANDRVAGSVQIAALPEQAPQQLWPDAQFEVSDESIVLNARVAAALDAKVGDRVALLVELPASVPRDSLLGERDEVLAEVDFTVSEVLPPESGVGRFSLSPAQQIPAVVFVSLPRLQQALELDSVRATRRTAGREARINSIFSTIGSGLTPLQLATDFANAMTLDDIDVRLVEPETGDVVSVESRSQILPQAIAEAAHETARDLGTEPDDVLVYLVNEIANADEEAKFSMYSVLAGVDSFDGFEFEGNDSLTIDAMADDEIVINRWLADDLGVDVGDTIDLSYLEVGDTGDLPEVEAQFTIVGIVKMTGDALDRTLTPTVPGITDAKTFSDWEQPYTMDLGRVTDRDEDYWDAYRATPKLFVSLAAMQRRFASRYGNVTSVRLPGVDASDVGPALLKHVDLDAVGISFVDIRDAQLKAASGTTDFSGLFFGFSLFLIASAVLLIGLLFRLGIETRVKQLGLLRAVGWTPKQVRRLLTTEGLTLAIVGGLIGIAAAVAYAAAMLYGLTTWWGGATGTQFLTLHVTPTSLVAGFAIAVFISLMTMWFAVRKLNQQEPLDLLSGRTDDGILADEASNRSKTIAFVCLPIAGLVLIALLAGAVPNVEAFAGFSWQIVGFFVVGSLLLVGGLAFFANRLGMSKPSSRFSLPSLAWQNLSRARGRSLLTTSLIASATFLLVAVAVARKDPTADEPRIDSGDGGYRLVAETATPILTDINVETGRVEAQFLNDADAEPLAATDTVSLRMRPGDDASCLNLYSARLPTLIGVPPGVVRKWSDEGRFAFADTPSKAPWLTLLNTTESNQAGEPNDADQLTIPVLGDMNTLLYSLHKGVGQSIDVPNEVHPNASLEVTGMLSGSVFQGVLLMSDDNLRKVDPGVVGFRYFLVETDARTAAEVTSLLESGLADYGFDAEPVAVRLANFLAVQNTYLSTFQALGGLGLLLGTLGLGTVMLRNVVERRRELALMRAVGFQPRRLRRLILGENARLLITGLFIGTVTALLAMAPHIQTAGADVPWVNLMVLIVAVFIVGMVSAVWAVRRAEQVTVLEALQSE